MSPNWNIPFNQNTKPFSPPSSLQRLPFTRSSLCVLHHTEIQAPARPYIPHKCTCRISSPKYQRYKKTPDTHAGEGLQQPYQWKIISLLPQIPRATPLYLDASPGSSGREAGPRGWQVVVGRWIAAHAEGWRSGTHQEGTAPHLLLPLTLWARKAQGSVTTKLSFCSKVHFPPGPMLAGPSCPLHAVLLAFPARGLPALHFISQWTSLTEMSWVFKNS